MRAGVYNVLKFSFLLSSGFKIESSFFKNNDLVFPLKLNFEIHRSDSVIFFKNEDGCTKKLK